MMEVQKIWQATLGELELALSKANFTTWFKNTFISSSEDGTIVISVPNTFTKVWLEKKYHSVILKALQKITDGKIKGIVYQVEVRVNKNNNEKEYRKEVKTATVERIIPTGETPTIINKFGLNPRYTFANFVIGKGNELAHATSLAVTQKPGEVYNPLFIYGGVGLGKTHLMQAIGNQAVKEMPEKKILYVSCEKFTNDFIKSISTNQTDRFKDAYRSVDILLIDDIHFLAGKEGIQEAFFHTFNDLHQANKQIVITSDRPPKAIPALEDRLVSRFEWGMIADISIPDLETRTAILRSKMAEKNYKLSDEVINYLATSIQNNIRELEGALNKIVAYHQLNGDPPALENVKKILSAISATQNRKSITPKQIISVVAEFYDLKIENLLGSCRKKNLAGPRQIIMYLMREELKCSYPTIGQEVGNRDHTTAMHAYLKITQALEADEKINKDTRLIKERLYNR